jgi:hypothetical protein
MALRDEIPQKRNQLTDIDNFLAKQKNKAEWVEILSQPAIYSNQAVADLFAKYKFKVTMNGVYRWRKRNGIA